MSEVNPADKWREDGILHDPKQDEIDSLRSQLARSRGECADLLSIAWHTHEARYYKADDGQMKLTDSCKKCGLDLRHIVHAVLGR